MAFVANNSQQMSLSDSTFNLTEREKKSIGKILGKNFCANRVSGN